MLLSIEGPPGCSLRLFFNDPDVPVLDSEGWDTPHRITFSKPLLFVAMPYSVVDIEVSHPPSTWDEKVWVEGVIILDLDERLEVMRCSSKVQDWTFHSQLDPPGCYYGGMWLPESMEPFFFMLR